MGVRKFTYRMRTGELGTGKVEDCGLVGESLLTTFTINGRNIHSRSAPGCTFYERFDADKLAIGATHMWIKDDDART
jgi:hypothetical protein